MSQNSRIEIGRVHRVLLLNNQNFPYKYDYKIDDIS